MAGADGARSEQRRQLQFDPGRKGERAFGTDQKMREIDVVAPGYERVEIIAADPALYFWKLPFDLVRFAGGNGNKIANKRRRHVDAGLAHAPEMRARAVGENGIDRENVFAGIAVTQRPRTAGIVADHAADGGARGGGNVDRNHRPWGLSARLSSSSTMPGSTRQRRSAASIAMIRLR